MCILIIHVEDWQPFCSANSNIQVNKYRTGRNPNIFLNCLYKCFFFTWIRNRIRILIEKKPWIRIRKKQIRIRNTARHNALEITSGALDPTKREINCKFFKDKSSSCALLGKKLIQLFQNYDSFTEIPIFALFGIFQNLIPLGANSRSQQFIP